MSVILGLSIGAFTALHVALSLVGIASGLVVAFGLMTSRRLPVWTAIFLATTTATSATGFLFHSKSFGPPHVVGILSLGILAVALTALYGMNLAGFWRWTYVMSAVIALYLNAFVGVVQAFQKIPWLRAVAPTGSEPPFIAAQLALLAASIALAILGAKRFRPPPGVLRPN
jgi:hypothetical protein